MTEVSNDGTYPRAESLVGRILSGETGDGRLLNDLVSAFYEGFPLRELRKLFTSTNEHVVAAGMWVASELGSRGRPLLNDVVALLTHPNANVRYYAVDFVMNTVEAGDRDAITSVIGLVSDSDSGVRQMVMKFLLAVPEDIIKAAIDQEVGRLASPGRNLGLRLIVESIGHRDADAILAALASNDPIVRRYAVAAAGRLRPYDRRPLEQALRSDDDDVSTFASRLSTRGLRNVH